MLPLKAGCFRGEEIPSPAEQSLSEVKEVAKEALLFLPPGIVAAVGSAVLIVVVIVVITAAVVAFRRRHERRSAGGVMVSGGGRRRDGGACAFDDFIQLAAVEPDTAALRTEVYFDSLTISHGEGDVAFWAVHEGDIGVGIRRQGIRCQPGGAPGRDRASQSQWPWV